MAKHVFNIEPCQKCMDACNLQSLSPCFRSCSGSITIYGKCHIVAGAIFNTTTVLDKKTLKVYVVIMIVVI